MDVIYKFGEKLFEHRLFDWLPDKAFIRLKYRVCIRKKLNLKNPQTYNEKLQWLKLYDRNPAYTEMVDKLTAKKYIAKTIGEEYVVPLLGVWDDPESIDFDALPEKFVLKANHDSGTVIVCSDKNKLNRAAAVAKLKRGLLRSGMAFGREWPYKDIKRCIIAEEYLEDSTTKELRDYKFFVFDGVVKAMIVVSDRIAQNEHAKYDYFDADFNRLQFTMGGSNSSEIPQKPKTFDKMTELAEKLGKGLPHVRVDFYEVDGRTYFGEMTFYSGSGFVPFDPPEWDAVFGSWLTLPKKNR